MLGELLPAVPYVGVGIWACGFPAEHGGLPASWKQAWTGGQARKEGEYWGQLEPQGGLELIWSYTQNIFLSLKFS